MGMSGRTEENESRLVTLDENENPILTDIDKKEETENVEKESE